MCSERTANAASYAAYAAAAVRAVLAANAAYATARAVLAANAADADNWDKKAIDRIKKITTPPAAQRTWVDLTPDDIQNCYGGSVDDFARALLAKSKELNK
jgi:DNA topoisomerase IB